ncbi:MAG TPA: M12 family metallo-peptidase, partial [Polyangia bacterium]|nr:M12 family metallo-peptidase [Polyangia bacterium]
MAAVAVAGCAATDDDPIADGTGTSAGAPIAPASSGTSLGAGPSSVAHGLGTGTDPAQYTGRIERTYYDDFHNNTFRTEYHLRLADGSRLKLDFAGKTPPLPQGKQLVQLRAAHVNGRLLVETAPTPIGSSGSGDGETVANQGDPGIAPLGAQKYAVIMIKYDDDPNMPYTQDEMRTLVFTGPTSATHYIQENSYGKSTMVGINRWDGDIYGWISVPHLVCGPGPCDCLQHVAAAEAQLTGVDLNAYDNISYVVPGMSDICGNSGFAYNDRQNVIQWVDPYIFAHELGHNFGAPHSGAYTCYDAGNVRVPLAVDSQCVSDQEYGDLHDVMGLGLRHMHAFNKMRLGY